VKGQPPRIFWAGFIAYLFSFFLVSVGGLIGGGTSPLVGGYCAFFAFFYPWVEARDVLLHNVPPLFGPLAYVSLVVSGLINPIFLCWVFLELAELSTRFAHFLRFALLVMIPFSWIFIFFGMYTYPREGNILWIGGMLLAMFSDRLASATGRREKISPG
jgi:hypothetical protein